MPKAIFLSYDGMTDPLGQSQVLPYLTELTKKGVDFHLISFEKEEKFALHQNTIQGICDRAKIQWHPLSYTKKPPLLSTIYDVWRMYRLTKEIVQSEDIAILHCRSYISALIGLIFQKRYRTKFIFDMRGFWADERVEGGIWNLNNPIFKTVYNYFKQKEIQYFNSADHTISLTHKGKAEILSWKSIEKNPIPIQVIPCCVDLDKFNLHNIPNIAKSENFNQVKASIDGKFVLGYVGSIGTWYMLDEMLDFFVELKKKRADAVFLFITQEKDNVITAANKKHIPLSDIIITSCLHQEVPLFISLFHASIFFIRPTFSKTASSPTKQGEIMSLGVPIICNAGVGDTDFVIKKYHAGEIVDDFNAIAYQKAIENILNTQYDSQEIIRGAEEFYSLKNGAERYWEVYQGLLKTN